MANVEEERRPSVTLDVLDIMELMMPTEGRAHRPDYVKYPEAKEFNQLQTMQVTHVSIACSVMLCAVLLHGRQCGTARSAAVSRTLTPLKP